MNYLWDTQLKIPIIIYFWNVVLEIYPNIFLCEVNFQYLRVGKSVPPSAGTIKNPFTCCLSTDSLLAATLPSSGHPLFLHLVVVTLLC